MSPLTAEAVRRSMINCSKGDTKRMTIPDTALGDVDEVEFLGWHDPRLPGRAYVVTRHQGAVVGVALRAAPKRTGRTVMCALCRTTRTDGEVSLYTAPRAGAPGRAGDSVGTLICDDLACPATARLEKAPSSTVVPDLGTPLDERVAALRVRVDAFLAAITGVPAM